MKKIAITQPYLFPYIGYFQIMKAVDEYVVYDDVQYIKRGWINRNNIIINGEKKLFTISLQGASANKLINEIEISDDFVKFKKMIAVSYAKAPHKDQVIELINRICDYPDKNLARFINNSFAEIAAYLRIDTPRLYSSDLEKDNSLRGPDKIISICKERGANQYINTIGGQDLYSVDRFRANDLELKFLKTNLQHYPQFDNEFIPGLSIIDVMMFNSSETISQMLDDYELV